MSTKQLPQSKCRTHWPYFQQEITTKQITSMASTSLKLSLTKYWLWCVDSDTHCCLISTSLPQTHLGKLAFFCNLSPCWKIIFKWYFQLKRPLMKNKLLPSLKTDRFSVPYVPFDTLNCFNFPLAVYRSRIQ